MRARPPADPVVRFETPPGQQAQVDFAHFRWGRRYALLVVLGYSRLLWLHFYPRQDMRSLMRGLGQPSVPFGASPEALHPDEAEHLPTQEARRPEARPLGRV